MIYLRVLHHTQASARSIADALEELAPNRLSVRIVDVFVEHTNFPFNRFPKMYQVRDCLTYHNKLLFFFATCQFLPSTIPQHRSLYLRDEYFRIPRLSAPHTLLWPWHSQYLIPSSCQPRNVPRSPNLPAYLIQKIDSFSPASLQCGTRFTEHQKWHLIQYLAGRSRSRWRGTQTSRNVCKQKTPTS